MTSTLSFDPTIDRAPSSARLVRALGLLCGVGASVALAAQFTSMRQLLPDFIVSNQLGKFDRTLVILSAGIGAFAALIVSAIIWLFGRPRALERIETLARLISPGLVAALVPLLFSVPPWHKQPLVFLALLCIAGALMAVTVEMSLAAAASVGPRLPRWLAFLLRPVAFAARMANRRWPARSLIVLTALAYTALAGRVAASGLEPWRPGAFAAPRTLPHLVYEAMRSGPFGTATYFWLSAVLIGAAAIVFYGFAARWLSRRAALALSVCLLLYAPMHHGAFRDPRSIAMAPLIVFTLFWTIAAGRRWPVAALVPILWLLGEDTTVGVAVTGVFLLVVRHRPNLGAALLGTTVAWWALATFVFFRTNESWSWWFVPTVPWAQTTESAGLIALAKAAAQNPLFFWDSLLSEAKLIAILHWLAPLVFLPVRRTAMALLVVPGLMLAVLTTAPVLASAGALPLQWSPYLFAAAVLVLHRIESERGHEGAAAALCAALLALSAHSVVFGAVFVPKVFLGSAEPSALRPQNPSSPAPRPVLASRNSCTPSASPSSSPCSTKSSSSTSSIGGSDSSCSRSMPIGTSSSSTTARPIDPRRSSSSSVRPSRATA